MPRLQTPAFKGCWVDVFANPTFGGAMQRLSAAGDALRRRKSRPRLNSLGSIIVGPHAVARVRLADRPAGADISLPPGTVVPDLSKICRTDLIIDLRVESLLQREFKN